MRKFIRGLYDDHFYRNSLYLILNTGIMGLFGFLFWSINARIYSVEQVGIASTLISVMGLLVSLSGLGLGVAITKYLPKSDYKEQVISSCLILTTIATIITSFIFVIGINLFSPKINLIRSNVFILISFFIFMIFGSGFNLIDSIFIAQRNSKYVLIKNTIWSILKVILSALLVSLGAYGIFSSWMIAMILAVIISFFFLKVNLKWKMDWTIIQEMFSFSFYNYIAGFLSALPFLLLPIMITNLISPIQTAHFYVALMLSNLLFVIPTSVGRILLNEGSYEEMRDKIKKSFKIIFILLGIGVLLLILFGKLILGLFGPDYVINSYIPLVILALSAIPFAINSIYISLKMLNNGMINVIITYIAITGFTLFTSYLVMPYGLIGISTCWLLVNVIISIILGVRLWKEN